jgi:uncharacterized peroxidase-related enzyme
VTIARWGALGHYVQMSHLQLPANHEVSTQTAEQYESDRQRLGYVANYTRTFAHRPAVYAAWAALNASIKETMSPRVYELASVAVAAHRESSYCTIAHGKVLAEKHFSASAVRSLLGHGEASELTDTDRAVYDLATKVAERASAVTRDDYEPLRALGFSDTDILDVVLAASARLFFSSVLEATGAQPDAAYRELDPDLLDALTVGRPVAKPDAG